MEVVGREVGAPPAPAPPRVFVDQASVLYRALRWLSAWAVRWIFHDVQFQAATPVPPRGPVLLVLNHRNELCDILLAFASTPRPIHFVGAIAHAASPVVAAALRAIGAVFVYRAHERTAANGNADEANRAAMQQMLRVLQQGGVLAIFPEGGVRRDDPIGRLQPGAAALALRAVREGGVAALSLVPIGIGYDDPDTIRGVARVTIGAPLDVRAWDASTHGVAAATVPTRTEITRLLAVIAERLGDAARTSGRAATDYDRRQTAWSLPRLLLALPIALWGAVTHAPAFALVLALGRATMRDPVERLGRLAVPGVIPMLAWYGMLIALAVVAALRHIIPPWFAILLVLSLPYAAWAALRWADAWRARNLSA